MEEVERFFRQLVTILSDIEPHRLHSPVQISEIYQTILPYRRYRAALGFDTSQDYEMALLRFLAGEGGFASIDPAEVQAALVEEVQSINPNPGAFRDYAAAKVYLNSGAVRTVTEAQEVYAPPPEPDSEREISGYAPPDTVIDAYAPPIEPSSRPSLEPDLQLAPDPELEIAREGDFGRSNAATTTPIDYVVPTTPPEDSAPAPQNESAPATCAWCSRPLPGHREVTFCPFCGKNIQTVECPACGTELEASWRFCITCGQRLED